MYTVCLRKQNIVFVVNLNWVKRIVVSGFAEMEIISIYKQRFIEGYLPRY